jgi:hypothetical protein
MFRKIVLFLSFTILAVIAVRQAACQIGAPPNPAEATGKYQTEPREAIRQALIKKISWDFNELSLSDVVEFLHKELNIPIRLDVRALNDMGVAPDSPVTFKLSGISAKSALNLLLSDLGLATIVRDEVLLITSRDVADMEVYTVLYDVSGLPAYRGGDGKTVPDFGTLTEILTSNIKPTSWDIVGGSGSVGEYDAGNVQALVVSQTEEVHEQIANLLSDLRKLQKGPLNAEEIAKLPPVPAAKPKPEKPHLGGVMGGTAPSSSGKGDANSGGKGGTDAGGEGGKGAPAKGAAGMF